MIPGPTVASGLARAQADEVILLLAAMGIESRRVEDLEAGWAVLVADDVVERARAIVADEYPDGVPLPAARSDDAARRPSGLSRQLWLGPNLWAVLVAAVACIYWFVRLHGGVEEVSRARFLDYGAITWDQVWVGEWWRLASAVFVHFDGAHLTTNLITLAIVGPPLATLLGPWRFLAIFLLTGIAGNVFSHVFAPSGALKAGASGAVAGVLGALGGTSLDPGWGRRFKRWQVLGALAAVYALLVGAGPDRDNAGHLGGLLAGIVLGRLLTPWTPPSSRPPGSTLPSATSAASESLSVTR